MAKKTKRKAQVDDYGYPLKPTKNRDGTWFYTQRSGLEVYVQGGGEVWRAKIPWSKIRAANDLRRRAERRR